MGRHSFAFGICGIVVIGVLIRVLYTTLLAPWPPPIGSDAWFYHYEADFLSQGRGFVSVGYALLGVSRPSAAHPPLYPLLLAAVAEFGGSGHEVQQLVGSVFGGATIVGLGFLGRRLVNERVGLIAAAIAAVYPMLVTADGALMSESLYGLLITLFLLAAYRWIDRPSDGRAAWLGVLLGLAALTRGEAVLLTPLVMVAVWRQPGGRRAALIAGCVTLLVIAPWTVRNWTAFHQIVPISTNFASAVAGANCASTYYGSKVGDWDNGCVKPYPGNEAQAFNRAESDAVRYARDHLGRLPVVAAVRLARIWGIRRNLLPGSKLPHLEGRSPLALEFGFAMYYVLVPLSVYGLLVLRRRRTRVWPLASMFVLVSVVAVLIYGEVRFREPAEISLVALAAVAVDSLWRNHKLRRVDRRGLEAAGAAVEDPQSDPASPTK